jgi:hypothetical protein
MKEKQFSFGQTYPFGICRAAYYSKPILLQIIDDIEKEFKNKTA